MVKELTKVGKYKIDSKLAEGGMGAVFRATHPTLQTEVILKRLTMDATGGFIERFKREAKISLHLKHDHIIQVYDHFKEASSYYMVMEYVDGDNLQSILQKKRYFGNDEAALIFLEICRGLLYAHEHGVIHRDIKPANILISHEGQVKIADFGISSFKSGSDDQLTQAGMSFGTPSYMSPEQFDDTKSVDNRADIYSMGVLLYEMVTGKKPFAGGMSPTNVAAIQKGKYPKPRKINPHVSPLIQRVIRKAMRKNKKRRYQSLRQVIAILEKQLRGLVDQPTINKAIKEIAFYDSNSTLMAIQRGGIRSVIRGASGILKFAALLGALGLVVYWAYLQGYHHEYFSRNTMGRMQVIVNLNDAVKPPEDIYLKASLFNMVDGVADSLVSHLKPFKARYDSSSVAWQIVSHPLYLPNGVYALDLSVEKQSYRTSFILAPRNIQILKATTSGGRILTFNLPKPPRIKINMEYTIIDAATGDPVPGANITFSRGRGWQPWPGSADELLSGGTYRFRAVADGYERSTVRVRIPRHQTDLQLQISMTPLAGQLQLETTEIGLQVLINNSDFYLTGGNNPEYLPIGKTTGDVMRLSLPPGEYYLTLAKTRLFRENIRHTERIIIQSGAKLAIKITYNPDNRALSLKY